MATREKDICNRQHDYEKWTPGAHNWYLALERDAQTATASRIKYGDLPELEKNY